MKKTLGVMLALVMVLSSLSAYCAPTDAMSVSVSQDAKTITLSGVCNSKFVTVYLLALGKTKEDVYDGFGEQDVLYYMNQLKTDSDGKYSVKIPYREERAYTLCVRVDGSYVYKDIYETGYGTVAAGLGNIYNLPETPQPIYGDNTKERFENAREQLPAEMPVYKPVNVENSATTLFVAPNAQNGDGSIEKPFGKISDALNALKKKGTYESATIYLRGGVYDNVTVTYISNIVANSQKPLIISAYGDENVVMTNGIRVGKSDFESITDRSVLEKIPLEIADKIKCVDLKKKGISGYESFDVKNMKLFADGAQYTVARWPNASNTAMKEYKGADGENGVIDSGSITTTMGSVCGSPREVGKYGEAGFEFCLADARPLNWKNTGDIYLNGSFYEEWTVDTVKVKSFNSEKQSVRTQEGIQWGAKYGANNKFYFSNVLEELDVPGEWFLDKSSGKLYVYPHTDVEELVLSYKSGTCLSITNSQNVVVNGIKFKDFVGTAVSVWNSSNVMVQNCIFDNGGTGFSVGGDTSRFCGVINSSFNEMNYAVMFLPPSVKSEIMKNLIPQYNYVQNNYIHGDGGILIRGNAHIVSHNVFSNTRGSSIYADMVHDIVVEFNEVLCGATKVSDSGPIYLGGNGLGSGGNHVRYNYIHNHGENRSTPYGIYFDDFMSRSYAYGNIVDGCMIFLHNGSDNAVYNNIILNSNKGIHDSQNYSKDGGLKYRWKIVALDYGAITDFLESDNESKYLNVTDGAYAQRFPTLKDWAEKMLLRIAEYNANGKLDTSEYTVTYPDGTAVDLDEYLRSPRFNYYENNFILNSKTGLELCKLGKKSATALNNYVDKNSTLFSTGYNSAEFEKAKEYIAGFEPVEYDKIGLVSDVPSNQSKPVALLPADNQVLQAEDLAFKWSSVYGGNEYLVEFSENSNFSDVLISGTTRLNVLNLSAEQAAKLKNDVTYYWRIKPVNLEKTRNVSVSDSDTYSFTLGGSKHSAVSCGIGVNSVSVKETDVGGQTEKDVEISMFLYNCSDVAEAKGTLYVAGYDAAGTLVGVTSREVDVTAQSITENFDVKLNCVDDYKDIKMFYWNSNITPYCESLCMSK